MHAEPGVFLEDYINTMDADALALWVCMLSAGMAFIK